MHKQLSGFSLIELSVVLVVISLIVGGILLGRDLVKNAEIRNVISEVQSHLTSINTFRLKYDAMPGDFKKATIMIGGSTLNGNGDERIDIHWPLSASPNESVLAWQHLSMARMTSGEYPSLGVRDWPFTPGEDIPSSRVRDGGYAIFHWPTTSMDFAYYGKASNFILYGSSRGAVDDLEGPALAASEAYMIDTKLDDGYPATGKVFVINGNYGASGCVTGTYIADPATVAFEDLSSEVPSCMMTFMF